MTLSVLRCGYNVAVSRLMSDVLVTAKPQTDSKPRTLQFP